MLEQASQLLHEQDSAAVIVFLNQQGDAPAVAQCYADLARKRYNQAKDVTGCILITRAGIQYCLMAADAAVDEECAYQLRSAAKAMSYDLSANLWPGWDDPGITIDGLALAIGMDAARTNLRLALELAKEDLPLSRAYWLMGAHQMAQGQLDVARASFATAGTYATSADAVADALLAQGYSIMTKLLAQPDDVECLARFDAVKTELDPLEHGEFFIQQLDTALRVMREK